jgi:hypothetical protein
MMIARWLGYSGQFWHPHLGAKAVRLGDLVVPQWALRRHQEVELQASSPRYRNLNRVATGSGSFLGTNANQNGSLWHLFPRDKPRRSPSSQPRTPTITSLIAVLSYRLRCSGIALAIPLRRTDAAELLVVFDERVCNCSWRAPLVQFQLPRSEFATTTSQSRLSCRP